MPELTLSELERRLEELPVVDDELPSTSGAHQTANVDTKSEAAKETVGETTVDKKCVLGQLNVQGRGCRYCALSQVIRNSNSSASML